MLEQCCNHSKQSRNDIATLCYAKNRRYESSRVTSPISNDEGDGSENVPQKVNSQCLELHRSYFNSLNLSNIDDISGVKF